MPPGLEQTRSVHMHSQVHLTIIFCNVLMQTVEATAASQRFVYKANSTSAEQYVPSIECYVILLPTILSVMYGQGEWPEESVSTSYGDHIASLQHALSVLCARFLSVTLAGH